MEEVKSILKKPYYLGNVKFSTTTAIPPFCIAVSIATAII